MCEVLRSEKSQRIEGWSRSQSSIERDTLIADIDFTSLTLQRFESVFPQNNLKPEAWSNCDPSN